MVKFLQVTPVEGNGTHGVPQLVNPEHIECVSKGPNVPVLDEAPPHTYAGTSIIRFASGRELAVDAKELFGKL